jgi:hypothetical protein
MERALCRIPHVTQAHVVPDERDTVIELHIVASPGKHPKQVVRDVQSLAMAAFGVEVDRHVVSVVQLEDEVVTLPEPPPEVSSGLARTLLAGMSLQSQQGSSSVSVRLRWCGREAEGSATRPATALGLHRMTAEATLDALCQLHPADAVSDVDGVEVRQLGSRRVALVSIAQRLARSDDVLVGTANVRAAGELDAVARAVLDAVNRRLRL